MNADSIFKQLQQRELYPIERFYEPQANRILSLQESYQDSQRRYQEVLSVNQEVLARSMASCISASKNSIISTFQSIFPNSSINTITPISNKQFIQQCVTEVQSQLATSSQQIAVASRPTTTASQNGLRQVVEESNMHPSLALQPVRILEQLPSELQGIIGACEVQSQSATSSQQVAAASIPTATASQNGLRQVVEESNTHPPLALQPVRILEQLPSELQGIIGEYYVVCFQDVINYIKQLAPDYQVTTFNRMMCSSNSDANAIIINYLLRKADFTVANVNAVLMQDDFLKTLYPSEAARAHFMEHSFTQAMRQLRSLDCSNFNNFTNSQLQTLCSACYDPNAGVSRLQRLNLSGCYQLSNEGLRHLSSLINLQDLNLGHCPRISDLAPLSTLTQLRTLNLWNCLQILDLASLSTLTQLQSISLARCQISNLAPLSTLTQLQNLTLRHCIQILDLAPLSTLTQLQNLDLGDSAQISNLTPLSTLTQLRTLNLRGCRGISYAERIATATTNKYKVFL